MKPENILLFGDRPVPKITDFGTSKVLQTMIQNTSMTGTPKYIAPEVMSSSASYGVDVDNYSLSIVFYELFSGKDAYEGYHTWKIISAVNNKEKPEMPEDFPVELLDLVQRGWDHDPRERPSLEEFKAGLREMASFDLEADTKRAYKNIGESNTTVGDLKNELDIMVHPLISMKWPSSNEERNSETLRKGMIKNLREKSNMKNKITESVYTAMACVPRHLFIDLSKHGLSQEEGITLSYTYNTAMGATKHSNESSPEIIGTQLSFTKVYRYRYTQDIQTEWLIIYR